MSRFERVQSMLKREVSSIIHDELNDPRLGFITVTKVEMTPDLRYAKIFYSVFGQDEAYKKTKEALDSASGFIRKLVGERMDLRFVPEIAFKEDKSAQYSVRIQEVLDQIKELNEPAKSSRVRKKTQ
jgi:ribosome-binding factor A